MLPTSQGCFQKDPDPGKLNRSNSEWPSKNILKEGKEEKRTYIKTIYMSYLSSNLGTLKAKIYDTVWIIGTAMGI